LETTKQKEPMMDRIEQAEYDLMAFDTAMKGERRQEAQAWAMAAQAQALLALCERLDDIIDEDSRALRVNNWEVPQ
jgi:hypothetical protein